MSVNHDSVSPTVATALAPSLETKKTSHTANTLSISISSTIGMARTRIARDTDPCVKSRCDPRRPSRIESHSPPSAPAASGGSAIVEGREEGGGNDSAADSDIDVLTWNLET